MKSKRFLFLIGLVLMMCSVSSAAALCPDGASYATYVTLNAVGGCFIDGLLFNNFTYTPTSVNVPSVPATGVTVSTIGPAGSGATIISHDPGFLFNPNLSVGPGQSQDTLIGYTVQTRSGEAFINDNDLLMVGAHTGTGIASIVETKCFGASLAPCPGGALQINVHSGPDGTMDVLTAHANFANQSLIGIFKDISVKGGDSGTAFISGAQNTYSVPEPAPFLLIGSGLLGLSVVRRKMKGISLK